MHLASLSSSCHQPDHPSSRLASLVGRLTLLFGAFEGAVLITAAGLRTS